MSRKKSLKLSYGIKLVIAILLIFSIVGFVLFSTNGFKSEIQTFYIEYNGKRISDYDSSIAMPIDKDLRFSCKYLSGQNMGYDVKLVPNADKPVRYTMSSSELTFLYNSLSINLIDLTYKETGQKIFSLDKHDDYFILKFDKDITIRRVIYELVNQDMEEDVTITVDNKHADFGEYYTLIISSYDNSFVYSIDVDLSAKPESIEIDMGGIVF